MTVSYPRRRVVRLSHQRLRQRHAVVGLVLHVVLEQVPQHHHHSFRQLPTNTIPHTAMYMFTTICSTFSCVIGRKMCMFELGETLLMSDEGGAAAAVANPERGVADLVVTFMHALLKVIVVLDQLIDGTLQAKIVDYSVQ